MAHVAHGPGDDVARMLHTLQQPAIGDDEVDSLVHASSQPMFVLDDRTHVLTANAQAEALFERGRESLRGRPFARLVDGSDRAIVRQSLLGALRSRQGPSDLVVTIGTPSGGHIRATITFLPFTANRRTRLALLIRKVERKQKLEDLGLIVSGIAHEMRTPTAYIENVALLSETKAQRLAVEHPEAAAQAEELRSLAGLIRQGAHRLRNLLHGLQPLTRNRPTHPEPVDLAVLVEDAVRTFRGSASDVNTQIELDLQATHPVDLDIEEMSRVLLNLIKNASEAMDGGGRIVIRTLNRDQPPQIRVEDEGPGVPEGARIFEPFFTTKEDGTGLGLAISRRIVEAHGGELRYERNERGGATFIVVFPKSA